MDTKAVLQLIAEDSRGSFDLFYHRYYDRVFRFSYYFLKDKEACREVVADVFVSIWQSRHQLAKIENIETYLYVIARNEAKRNIAQRNAHRVRFRALDEIPVHLESTEGQSSPEDDLTEKEMEHYLTLAINELPDRCRAIYLMARNDGMRPKEIAEALSITESTVRVQLKIAAEKLTDALRPYFPNLPLLLFFLRVF